MFSPSPEYPSVGNLTQLSFNVQDLKTGNHVKNVTGTVTVINNFTANVNTGINKGTPNGDFSIFKTISAPNGSFSIKDHFLQAGAHQIIARINSKNNIFSVLASLNVIVLSPQ